MLYCSELAEILFVKILLTPYFAFVFCLNSLGPVFALFVPFYCSIPRVQVTQILGQFSITNKTLVYVLGLQVHYMLVFLLFILDSALSSNCVCLLHARVLTIFSIQILVLNCKIEI